MDLFDHFVIPLFAKACGDFPFIENPSNGSTTFASIQATANFEDNAVLAGLHDQLPFKVGVPERRGSRPHHLCQVIALFAATGEVTDDHTSAVQLLTNLTFTKTRPRFNLPKRQSRFVKRLKFSDIS